MKIKLKINSWEDRIKIVTALANSGYSVKVEEKRERLDTIYWVIFEYKDEEQSK